MRKTQNNVRLGENLRELAAAGSTVDCPWQKSVKKTPKLKFARSAVFMSRWS